jgi:hypothetical protein
MINHELNNKFLLYLNSTLAMENAALEFREEYNKQY